MKCEPFWLLILSLSLSSCFFVSENIREAPDIQPFAAFQEIPVDFQHRWDDDNSHPFVGSAVIDVEGDGQMEVFIGGGLGQPDALFGFRQGRLVNRIEGTGLSHDSATYGAVSIDVDNNGSTDLIVCRQAGLFLYLNQGGKFEERKIPVDLPEDSVPMAVTVSDIDKDGDGDLYVSAFIDTAHFQSATFNDPKHAKPNRLLLNNGNLTFTDITDASGTASLQNTFLSVFVDLDGDTWQDLVVAQNTGEIEFFKNRGDATFESIPTQSGYGFWMGLAVGDIDKDGDQDLYFSNLGNSIPDFLTEGDLRDDQRHEAEWLLFRNDGNFQFTNVTEPYQLTGFGFAWGAVFEDLNLDGNLDLLVAQNYIKWPLHKLSKLPGKTLLQHNQAFYHVSALGLENPHFGQTPLILDLNGDSKPDVVWVNMNGPATAFLNTVDSHYVHVPVPDTVSALGTEVTLETTSGHSYTRIVTSGVGLMSDQTSDIVFGLGTNDKAQRLIIRFSEGKQKVIENPAIDQPLDIGW